MSAPAVTARQTPSGRKMGDGYQCLVAFAADPDAAFWEKEVTPPGIEGEDAVDTSTQHNDTWRTKTPQTLVTLTDFTMTVNYDPALYVSILNLVNVATAITIHFPNGDSLSFWGFLKSFVPGGLSRGNVPEATVTVVPTNQDPDTCEEEGPVFTAGAGTGPC